MTAAERTIMVLALTVALTLHTTASAHVCSKPDLVDVDAPVTVNLGVPAEEKPVVGVDVSLPRGFRLDDVEPAEGWTAERAGSHVRLRGGTVGSLGCEYFVLRGVATREGKLAFSLVARHEDGSATRYEGDKINDPLGAQLVFAGVVPSDADYVSDGGEGTGTNLPRLLSGALAGLAVGAGGGLVLRWVAARVQRRRTGQVRTARAGHAASRRSRPRR
jgi:hypothetical protein